MERLSKQNIGHVINMSIGQQQTTYLAAAAVTEILEIVSSKEARKRISSLEPKVKEEVDEIVEKLSKGDVYGTSEVRAAIDRLTEVGVVDVVVNVMPSDFVGGSGPIYILGMMVAIGARIQYGAMKGKVPNRGISEAFMRTPARPMESLGLLKEAVSTHLTKVKNRSGHGDTYPVRMYEDLEGMMGDEMPEKVASRQKYLFSKGKTDVSRLLRRLWAEKKKQETAEKAKSGAVAETDGVDEHEYEAPEEAAE